MAGQGLSVVSVRDMTQRQRTEQALHASSERYRLIVQTATEGIWMLDADDRTSFVRAEPAHSMEDETPRGEELARRMGVRTPSLYYYFAFLSWLAPGTIPPDVLEQLSPLHTKRLRDWGWQLGVLFDGGPLV